jgi:outer membrane biosynthesis protein TonB
VRIESGCVLISRALICVGGLILSQTPGVAAVAQDPPENRLYSSGAEQERAATLAAEAARRREAAAARPPAPALSHGKQPPKAPPEKPPPTPPAAIEQASANILVGVRPQMIGAPRAGDSVRFKVVVENLGPSVATYINLNQTLANLRVVREGSACSAPCSVTSVSSGGAVIQRLGPESSARLSLVAEIIADGPFRVDVYAESRVPDPDRSNNHGWLEGRALPIAAHPPLQALPQPAPTRPRSVPAPVESEPPEAAETQPAPQPVSKPEPVKPPLPVPAVAPQPAKPARRTGESPIGPKLKLSAPGNPSLSASMILNPPGPYRPGQDIALDIRIRDLGRAPSQGIAIANASHNLQIVAVAGDCTVLPCELPALRPGQTAAIRLTGRIDSDAAAGFQDRLLISTAGLRPGTLSVSADLPSPRNFAGLYLAAAAAGLAALFAAAATAWSGAYWRRAIVVTASLDSHGRTAIGPLAPIGPTLSISSRIEVGDATARGPISIQRTI